MDSYIEKFLNFLEKERVYNNYINNYVFSNWNNTFVVNYLANTQPNRWISHAFSWLNSFEGIDFWKKIHRKWMHVIETKRIIVPDNKLV